jgi:hypothetical protein
MGDLKSHSAIVAKGFLFLVLGGAAAAVLLCENWSWRNAALLAVAIWAFSRFYYFAFYVIEHYVDGQYRFDGLASFARWWLKRPPALRSDLPTDSGKARSSSES